MTTAWWTSALTQCASPSPSPPSRESLQTRTIGLQCHSGGHLDHDHALEQQQLQRCPFSDTCVKTLQPSKTQSEKTAHLQIPPGSCPSMASVSHQDEPSSHTAGSGNAPPKTNTLSETLARCEMHLVPHRERAALSWPRSWRGRAEGPPQSRGMALRTKHFFLRPTFKSVGQCETEQFTPR